MQENYVVCSTRPDISGTYLGQEGFIRAATPEQAQEYLAEKQAGKSNPQAVKLYRLVEVA